MSGIEPYLPPNFSAPIDLDLSRNEGRSDAPELLASIHDPGRLVSRYPDTTELRQRVATLNGVDGDQVLMTAGGDDALSRCFLAMVRPGATVVTTYPTFEMIPRYAEQRGAKLVEVPWWDGEFPRDAVLDAITPDTDAVFVVSPNNPTGSVAGFEDLRSLASKTPLLVLDAAYEEFADDPLTDLALGIDNMVVIRTMSKAYGLAGLRVGYLLGPADLVSRIEAFGNPYGLSALSAGLATARLDRPRSETVDFIAEVREERESLTALLTELGTTPLPSQANFVLTGSDRAHWIVDGAASLGVAFRQFANRPGLEDSVRITLPGDRDDYERLERTLRTVLQPEAVFFDLDGVLADVSRSQTRAMIETAAGYEVVVTPEDVATAKESGNANDDWLLTALLLRQKGVDRPLEEITARYEAIYQGDASGSGLKHQERPLVDIDIWKRWAGRFTLAVVTGRPLSDAEEFLGRHGMLDDLSALITKEDGPLKPDPAPVRMTLERLGVERAWMLGDTVDDLAAARSAGVVPIGVIAPGDEPNRTRIALAAAARVLSQTRELEELLP